MTQNNPHTTQASPDLTKLTFKPVTPDTWDDLVEFFTLSGDDNCWCMEWRPMPLDIARHDDDGKKQALKNLVDSNTPVGLLGYLDGKPLAWCSIAPKPTYYALWVTHEPESVWAIVCFSIHESLRGGGAMGYLVDAAIDYARKKGATILEAYPVDKDFTRDLFMGTMGTFLRKGFVELPPPGDDMRHIVQLKL